MDYGDALSAGFHNHIQGVTVLINQRGPQLFAEPTFHSILSLCRATVVSLQTKTLHTKVAYHIQWVRSLLGGSRPITEAAWSTMKWGPHIPNETGHLFDVLMSLPLLLDESNRLSEQHHSEQEYKSFITSLNTFTANISEWETAATKRAGRPLYHHMPTQGKNRVIFGTSDDSALMMYSWASRVFLYNARMKVYNASLWATHHRATENQDMTAWIEAATAADNIRDGMEYCVNPRVCGLGGLMLTIVPLMALKEFYQRCSTSREVYSTAVGEYTSALERGRLPGNADEKVRYGPWFSAPMEAEPSHGSS